MGLRCPRSSRDVPGVLGVLPRTRIADHKGCGGPDELGRPLSESADNFPAYPDGVPALGGVDYRCEVGAILRGIMRFSRQAQADDRHLPALRQERMTSAAASSGVIPSVWTVQWERAYPGWRSALSARILEGGSSDSSIGRTMAPRCRLSFSKPPADRLRTRLEAYDDAVLLHDAAVLLVHRQPAACRDHPASLQRRP